MSSFEMYKNRLALRDLVAWIVLREKITGIALVAIAVLK